MPRSIDLFIDSEAPIGDLAAHLGKITGIPFEEAPLELGWVGCDDSFRAVLLESQVGSSRSSALSRYRYTLSAQVADQVRLQEAPETIMMRLISEQLQRHGSTEVLLVLDLQFRDTTLASDYPQEHPVTPLTE